MTANGPTPTWPENAGETAWCGNCWTHIRWDGVQWRHEDNGEINCGLVATPE